MKTTKIFAMTLMATGLMAAPAFADSDPCDGFEDASWCTGASVIECEDGSTAPESEGCAPDSCEVEERSARGYCPGEPGHDEEREGTLDGGDNPCEEAGTCDDSCPHRDDCLLPDEDTEEPVDKAAPIAPATEAPIEAAPEVSAATDTLPETGAGMIALALSGLGMIGAGGLILRKS